MMEQMEMADTLNINEKAFVQRYFEDMNREFNNNSSDNDGEIPIQSNRIEVEEIIIQQEHRDSEGVEVKTCVTKAKRRSNLAEFSDALSIKRKNESAKRELTSVVNQLGKIDKQLNTKDDKSRVEINFMAKFLSFKSNRVNTFKYPVDAKIKQTFLDCDTTIATVKNAVKEAVNDLLKELPRNEADIIVTQSSAAPDELMTPTKTIAAFTALPSPVTVKGQPVSSKNLCAKNSCTFGKKQRKHVWIKCCYKSGEGQGCSYWVHATCLGFPTLKDDDVKMMDGWHCPEHTEILMKRK